ncbi:hypothetical protein [Streptomyces sp. AC495_CC817]|uniref:hypothetical protein n=1 Tax=Streptomyces sp. AC495_CC817 TaxID=2823900 RepID=UPI0035A92529
MPAHRTAHRTAPRTASRSTAPPSARTPAPAPEPAPEDTPQGPIPAPPSSPAPADTATDVVRWAAFSCVLVPVVLVWYGTSLAGATGAALGLAAVTGVCRVLLRQSERGAARAARTTARRSMAEDRTSACGLRGRSTSGAHGGGRNPGTSTPVD